MSNHMHNSKSATRLAAARRRIFAPLLLVALVAPAALADSRADAKRHFREGMSLIAAGPGGGGRARHLGAQAALANQAASGRALRHRQGVRGPRQQPRAPELLPPVRRDGPD